MADDFLSGGVDEAAAAIEALLAGNSSAPAGNGDGGGDDEEATAAAIEATEAAPATEQATEQNTDEEAPEGDTPVIAAPVAQEPQPKAEVPAPKQVTQEQPPAAPNAKPSAAHQFQQLTQHVTQLQANLQAAFPDIKSLEDLKRLAVEDPARVVAFDAHQREVQAAASHLPRLQAVAQAEWEQAETVKLHELIPDLKDNAKGAALREKIAAYALEAGYSPQKLQTVSAVEVKALHDAMQFRDWKAQQDAEAKKQAEAIVEARKKAADAPPVQKPGVSRTTDGKADKLKELKAKFERTGRIEDLAEYMEAGGTAS